MEREFDVTVRFKVTGAGDDDGARWSVEKMLQLLEQHYTVLPWRIEQVVPHK